MSVWGVAARLVECRARPMWETGRESLRAAALEQEGRRANGGTADSDILLADDGLVQTSHTGHQKAPEYSYIRDGCRNLKYARGVPSQQRASTRHGP